MNNLEFLENGGNGIILRYNGEDDIQDLPTRESLIKDDDITTTINNSIKNRDNIYFMPCDINEINFNNYQLRIFGTLLNGSKAEVNITDIDVFFDVGIPKGIKHEIIQNDINMMFMDRSISYWITDIYAKPLHGYNEEKQLFKRIHTNTTYNRTKLINIVKNEMKLEIYSNDSSHYYRKTARENKLYFSDWVFIQNYEYRNGNNLCEHIFTITKTDYIHLTDPDIRKLPLIIKDRTVVMAWDIETYSSRKTGEVPKAEYENDQAFMICMSVHWLHSSESLYNICIVDKETESDSRWTTIVCGDLNYCNIIKAMAICWNHFKPDIFIGYNDSGYDWPFVIEKAIQFDILVWMWKKMSSVYYKNQTSDNIIKWNYNNKNRREIKINAERVFYSQCPIIPGTICIDCLPCFMKIYPKLETTKYGSLKFYLTDNNLPSKVDLPVSVLWRNYEMGKDMREIAYYCIVDTISVQRLFVKRNILIDYREIASLAYVSLSDSHYYAGGVKVCNLLGAYAWDSNILVNMKPNYVIKTEKFPGAYVFSPDKGMTPNLERLEKLKTDDTIDFRKDRPVVCFDFASLYPSLIITYNLSPEKILTTFEEYQYNVSKNIKLHEIDFDMGDKHIQAWSILHENDDNKIGLFPTILRILFAKRKEMKQKLKYLAEMKEKTSNSEEYESLCFEYNYTNTKQNALKIYMNTFYGETGNQLSPFFLLQLAGGVTSAGQYNIKMVADYVKNREFFIKYGDSVMPYTPITIRYKNKIIVTTFDTLGYDWIPYNEFKPNDESRTDKQQLLLNSTYIWTQNGWSIIKRVIRHKSNKKIYRVVTYSGVVDVTEDHSLIDSNNRIITPSNCKIGTQLLHSKISTIYKSNSKKSTSLPIYTVNQRLAQSFYTTIPNLSIRVYNDPIELTDIYVLELNEDDEEMNDINNLRSKNEIISIKVIDNCYKGYVYDIETESGTFNAGIGDLILKNTDSLYITCPNSYFVKCDNLYRLGQYNKLEFFTEMVRITLQVINKIEEEINSFIEQNNGTKYLRMENEGCYYPCLFLGKKKYFGIQHVHEINFIPKKLYIKGIDVIKQGKSGIEKEIGHTIMRRAVSLDNNKGIFDIVKDIIFESINTDKWTFDDFILSSSWKPTKKNASVQQFMKRMKIKHEIEKQENASHNLKGLESNEFMYSPLDPGERFKYVLVKNNLYYDLQGRKITHKTGDLMEYAHVAKKENMKIDVVYYLVHYVIGICARFISSDEQFIPTNITDDKKIDEHSIKMAKKYLENYIKELSNDSGYSVEKGKEHKLLFKNALQLSIENINSIMKPIVYGPLCKIAFDESEDIISIIFDCASKEAVKLYKKCCKDFCKNLYIKTDAEFKLYKYLHINKSNNLNTIEYGYRKELLGMENILTDLSIQYKTNISYFIKTNIMPDFDYTELYSFKIIWHTLIGFELYKLQNKEYHDYLNEVKYKRFNMSKKPSKKDIDKIINKNK
jgi:DNA polymerase elongation subunit (family B)